MIKERIQEIFEFTKSESPYRKANKGWINQDIFLDLSPSAHKNKQKKEDAIITLFWSPINILLSNIFLIITIGSILVFTSISLEKDRFDFISFNNYGIIDNVNNEDNNSISEINFQEIDYMNLKDQQNLEIEYLDKSNKINLLDDDLHKTDENITNVKTDEKNTLITESKSVDDTEMIQKKIEKSNFI